MTKRLAAVLETYHMVNTLTYVLGASVFMSPWKIGSGDEKLWAYKEMQ